MSEIEQSNGSLSIESIGNTTIDLNSLGVDASMIGQIKSLTDQSESETAKKAVSLLDQNGGKISVQEVTGLINDVIPKDENGNVDAKAIADMAKNKAIESVKDKAEGIKGKISQAKDIKDYITGEKMYAPEMTTEESDRKTFDDAYEAAKRSLSNVKSKKIEPQSMMTDIQDITGFIDQTKADVMTIAIGAISKNKDTTAVDNAKKSVMGTINSVKSSFGRLR